MQYCKCVRVQGCIVWVVNCASAWVLALKEVIKCMGKGSGPGWAGGGIQLEKEASAGSC